MDSEMLREIIDYDNTLVRLNGNEVLLNRLLNHMKETYYFAYEEVVKLLKNKKKDDAIMLVHTIKGASANLGITELYKASSQLEKELKENEENVIESSLIYKFKESIDNTIIRI